MQTVSSTPYKDKDYRQISITLEGDWFKAQLPLPSSFHEWPRKIFFLRLQIDVHQVAMRMVQSPTSFTLFFPWMTKKKFFLTININTISSRQMMIKKKMSSRRLLVDPIPNSLTWHNESCMADSKENYYT